MLDTDISLWETAARLGAAALGGGALGWEREVQSKPAGLRTNALVSVGAATFLLLTIDLCQPTGEAVEYDPIRTVAGVVGGIGFLGAGSIFKSKTRGEDAGADVEGLTTAATIWASGAIGLACGAGRFSLAVIATALVLVILVTLARLERAVIGEH